MFTDHDLRIMQLENEVKELKIELAGKEAVIKVLHEDISYYRKDWKDKMIQDQGLENDKRPA